MDNNHQARNASAINENDQFEGNVAGQSGASRSGGNPPEASASGASASDQSSDGTSAKDMLRRLRAPGMTLTYTMEKQHVPDMDANATAGSEPSSNGQSTGGQHSGKASGQAGGQSSASARSGGQTPGTMQCSGSCRVRYFDLVVGAMLVMVLGCAMKCCCSCCRGMKRLF